MNFNRRAFLKMTLAMGVNLSVPPGFSANRSMNQSTDSTKLFGKPTQDGTSIVYRSINGTPEQNLRKVIELIGSIEKIIGSDDVILIKPNVMWWNQGAPNLSALKTFVDLVMNCPGGFRGEVVIAENCHRGPSPWAHISSGWAHDFERNSGITNVSNYNELSRILKDKYKERFSVCHLIDVGAGNKRVFGPSSKGGHPILPLSRG
jgi:hypothetical protein